MNRRVLIIVAGALCLSSLGLWIGQNLVREPVYILDHAHGAARRNPLYAAERLLARRGIAVYSVRSLFDLPAASDPHDTLIMSTPSYALTDAQARNLLQWVESGGHLMFAVSRDYHPGVEGDDRLLDSLKIWARETKTPSETPVEIWVDDAMPAVRVQFQGRRVLLTLHDGAYWKVGDGKADYMLHYRWGKGLITVFNDLSIFDNQRLGEHDHVDFLWGLLHLDGRRGGIWLQYAPQLPSLAQLLWENAWQVLAGLAVTLICGVWMWSRRVGPVIVAQPDEEQRSLLDHVQASGWFLWRQGAGGALLEAERQHLLRPLERHLPHWQRLTPAQRSEQIATLTGLPRERIIACLERSAPSSEREFLLIVEQLNQIGKKL